MTVLSEILKKYNISVNCRYQVSHGGEPPCCELKWCYALNDPRFAEKALSNTKKETGVSTSCIPGSMGRHCYGEDD